MHTTTRIVLAALVFATLAAPAHAAAPPAPPQGSCTTTVPLVASPGLAITDNVTVASQLAIAGLGPHLLDVDVITSMTHTFAADLDITLTSPAGTEVTLTTDNGGSNDNVFNGTLWDDDGGGLNPPGPVTDTVFENNVAETALVPEEALGALAGENSNGTWTLRVADDAAGDIGTLASWSLQVTSCSAPLPTNSFAAASTAAVAITDLNTSASEVFVSDACPYLADLDVTTNITHTFAADLDITLTSPSGTVLTLTTDNGGSNDNVFNGTVWDDDGGDANPPGAASDVTYANLVVETTLVPEEALAAFVGENPNGLWKLEVFDDLSGDGGTLVSWSLAGQAVCAPPAPPAAAALPTLAVTDAKLREGNRGFKTMRFLVRLSAPSAAPVTVNYSTKNGTAKARSDYRKKAGTLTFAPGVLQVAIAVKVRGDRRDERNERFFIHLSAPSGATLADARGRGLIRDNDP